MKEHKKQRTVQSADKVHTEDAIKERGEVFTSTSLAKEILDDLPQDALCDPQEPVSDPCGCGDGQFLVEVLRRRLEAGVPHKEALFTIYGVEIDEDNANKCRERLLMGSNDPLLKAITRRNIICGNPLKYTTKAENWFHVGFMWDTAPSLEYLENLSPGELNNFRAPTRDEWRGGGPTRESIENMKSSMFGF